MGCGLLRYGFTKDTPFEYKRKRKHYKQIVREHNRNRDLCEWYDSFKHCECKECTEASEYYIYMIEDYDFHLDHLQVGYYTKEEMKQEILKFLEEEKYDEVQRIAHILSVWQDEWCDYITCKIKYD